MRLLRILGKFTGRESGVAFIETAVALAILGVIAVAFLNGLTTSSKSVFTADEQTTADSLAQSQMEWVKTANYSYEATTYSPAPIPSGKDYLNYSALIAAEPLRNPDDGIQKITITIKRADKGVIKLEGYKVDR
jgi:type II secretory pathway pseudopilin PulG